MLDSIFTYYNPVFNSRGKKNFEKAMWLRGFQGTLKFDFAEKHYN